VRIARRAVGWSVAWVFSAALYLLLIDTRQLPELLVGAGAATLAATGAELAREQGIVGEGLRLRWLVRAYRPFLRAPADIFTVSLAALRQLLHPHRTVGAFRAVPFRCIEDEQLESGRHALAESLGSFAPNTIIVGVDREREMILGHQLKPSGGRESIDILELG
jgi:hypothetical protein